MENNRKSLHGLLLISLLAAAMGAHASGFGGEATKQPDLSSGLANQQLEKVPSSDKVSVEKKKSGVNIAGYGFGKGY